jgi:Putative esterase
VVLQDNGGDNLTVSANGPFTFATKLASGAAYAVTVQTQPAGQTCTVASGSGTIGSANVTNVAVSCASNPTFSVGGNVSGLTGSVVLQDNSGDDLTVSANGPFTFATQLAAGASYNVTVKTQPSGQTCTVASGTGTIGSANVTNVAVSCAATGGTATSAADGFNRADGPLGSNWADITDGGLAITSQAVAGTKTGAGDAGLTGDSWAADTFTSNQYSQVQVTATQLTGGQWIGPSVRAQSGGQNGYVGIYFWNSGSPQLMLFKRSAGNWTQIGGTVNISALTAGATLAVQATGSTISFLLNGTQKISATDTSFTGGAPGIMSFGTGQVDNWTGGSGTVPGGTSTFTVGGTVSGLTGTVVLQDNGGDDLSVTANGSFTFATPVTDGGSYAVTVKTQPSGQTCTVASGSGTVSGANVTSVAVTCAAAGGGGNGGSTPGADTFNRANGPLGPDWTDVSDGGLAITSQQVAGTAANGVSGDIRTAETYPGDQFSSVTVTTTQLTGGQWIGPMVRANSTGQQAYVGIYYWNSGSPDLMLFERSGSNWTQLGSTYNSGPLNPGDKLQVQAVGSTVSFLLNGVQRISATDTTLTGGAPGIMSFGTGQVDNWAGGSAGGGGTTTYTIGGTVSGLTGTVILQDNSGDSLSVAANGSFTFATPLADGATYNVTVRTNPSGQTCTVANGTGTVHAANVTSVSVTCAAGGSSTPGSDDFNRADGPLGPSWADVSDGGLAISGQQVTGTVASGVSGDIRTAETYQSDQFSQVTLTSTQLTGSQWIGPAVRMQNGGQNAYVGIYNWNGGSPNVMLFERNAGNWTQLGSTWNSGALAAGTTLKLMVTGSTLALMVNGTERIAVGDTTLSGGAPGIMANGTAQADNWSGGAASFEMHFLSTTGGISSYDIISASDSDGPHVLRVLQPTNPAAGVAHNFLFVLPVEPETGSQFGDAISYLKSLGAQNQYNLTIIEPAFGIDPWYADSSTDPNVQYETFMTQEMVPWAQQNLSTSGHEQNWLIGFSKSGIGGQDLILKHPGIFQLAASWDFPADMSSSTQFGDDSAAGYGTDANFQANYRLTQAFVDAHKGPFVSANRIWIGGYGLYQTDDSDYDRLLTTEGIQHTTETPTSMSHTWTSGWVPGALAALYADSQNLP